MRFKFFVVFNILCLASQVNGQPYNRYYLLGYSSGLFDNHVVSTKGQFLFDSATYVLQPDSFIMGFRASQATISDANGNLIISTNGCWIADATGDTMQNGAGLNPGNFSYGLAGWCNSNSSGQPFPSSSILLPFPGNSLKFVLFHETGDSNHPTQRSSKLSSSLIDLNLNNGIGGVVNKNAVVFADTLNHGITACKHANGRDWWIVMLKDSSDIAFVSLLTPSGIANVTQQSLGYPALINYSGQPMFSFDGTKFATHQYGYLSGGPFFLHEIRLNNFDRCTGQFTNPQFLTFVDSVTYGLGLCFSPDSKYLYWSTFRRIFQLNTDTSDIAASIQLVANYDNYCYPYQFTCTDFWLMYLAVNGKIYISSGNGVIDMHYINYPDSAGIACDVQQHAIRLPCYSGRTHVNHPNYALGPIIGSVCDSLSVGINELNQVRNVRVHPNPLKSAGSISIYYELPQNSAGEFTILDALGKEIFKYSLPPWSNMQSIIMPALHSGLYFGRITSGSSSSSFKLVVE